MGQIFFSYSRTDSQFVDDLIAKLGIRGVDVWLDRGAILAGESWRQSIVEAIRNCEIFIIVLSPNSVESENVAKELTLAEQYDKRVLPLVIEDVEIPPALDYQLAGLQHQTFAEGSYEENFDRLIRALVASGIEVRSESVASVGEPGGRQSPGEPIRKIGAAVTPPLSSSSQAVSASSRENAFKKVPIWLWVGGASVILVGLVVGLMSIVSKAAASQPTATLETSVAEIILEDTLTNTPTPTPTKTPTDVPTDTQEPTKTLESDLDPTETLPPTFTPTPSITPYPPIIKDDFGVSMVLVSAGSFILGSKDGDADEKPVVEVVLDGFYIDQFEVTNANYKECVDQGVCEAPKQFDSQTRFNYYGTKEYANYPVIYVSWDDAYTYCRWRGARLPTELEWEKAARGPDGQKYPWGNEFGQGQANYCGGAVFCPAEASDGYKGTAPVDAFEEGISPYGAYQMAGNVNEWTADWYDKNFYSSLTDGVENPPGPESGNARVLRGGSFGLNAEKLRTTNRSSNAPSEAGEFDGFRCAADVP